MSIPQPTAVDENVTEGRAELCVTLEITPPNAVTGNEVTVVFSTTDGSGKVEIRAHNLEGRQMGLLEKNHESHRFSENRLSYPCYATSGYLYCSNSIIRQ